MEKIAIQEQKIHSIANVLEGFTTHFSNIGDRQTKMENQMTAQNKSLQHLTKTIESLTQFILEKPSHTPDPPINNTPPYTPIKGQPITQLTPTSREPISTAVGDGTPL